MVLVTIIVVGAFIWLIDFGFQRGVRGLQDAVENHAEQVQEEESISLAEAESNSNAESAELTNALAAESTTAEQVS